MDFLALCQSRFSLRRFADRPVEEEKLRRCLEAARLAPSANNGQPCRYAVFTEPKKKQELCAAVFSGIYSASARFAEAPVIIALLIKTTSVIGKLGNAIQNTHFQLIDAGIAGEHLVLQAQELGLGTCWIGWYDPRALMRFLNLEGKVYLPVCLIAVGYPPEGYVTPDKNRRPFEEIVGWNGLP